MEVAVVEISDKRVIQFKTKWKLLSSFTDSWVYTKEKLFNLLAEEVALDKFC